MPMSDSAPAHMMHGSTVTYKVHLQGVAKRAVTRPLLPTQQQPASLGLTILDEVLREGGACWSRMGLTHDAW